MKKSPIIVLVLFILALLPNMATAWTDLEIQVGKTVVVVEANGSDTQWITGYFSDEAKGLVKFATTFNKTAYRDDLTLTERCTIISNAAQEEINQTSTDFQGLHDVKCLSVDGFNGPGLEMSIYPLTTFDYRFLLRFLPQP